MQIRALSPTRRYADEITPEPEVTEVSFPKLRNKTNLYKLFQIAAKKVGSVGINSIVTSDRAQLWEEPPYDLEQIQRAIDTDSYAQQAFNKYQELLWKSGYEITSDNPEALSYLRRRISIMEIAMNRSFANLLKEMTDHLVKYHNVFVVKRRMDFSQALTRPIETRSRLDPVAGFFMIPPEAVGIVRDRNNIPKKYKQRTDLGSGFSSGRDPVWDAEDVIHMYMNRKTGRLFGTPFVLSALDDIIALRQIEQDMQNLIHRELFPIFKYMIEEVNSDDPDLPEVDQIIDQLESMRTEGSLFLPPGHNVEMVGSNGEIMDIGSYLNHFKERVAAGLGVFPHHLGMVDFAGANRDMTDRLDQILYDKVKHYQREFEEMVSFHIFNEILLDGGFDPYGNLDGENSDQCRFKFKEIDIDTQIKWETHRADLYAKGAIQTDELRSDLRMPLDLDVEDTQPAIAAKIQLKYALPTAAAGATSPPKSGDGHNPATTGQRNTPNLSKGSSNVLRPQNQYGRAMSPNVRHSDTTSDLFNEVDLNTDELIEWYLDELGDD